MTDAATPLEAAQTVAVVCRRADGPGVLRLGEALTAAGLAWVALSPRALDSAVIGSAVIGPASATPAGDPAPCRPHALAICRLPSGTEPRDLDRLEALEGRARFVNRPSALRAVHDKAGLLRRLAEAGLPVPPTCVVMRGDSASVLDDLPGDRFVVKPIQGSAGRGVTMDLDRARAAANALAFADLSGPVLVQPVSGTGVDQRAFVVDGRIVAAMERVPPDGGGRANLAYGGRARAWDPDDTAAALALAAARISGLDVAGVDLLPTEDGPVVLEVNACPGFAGIEEATGLDVAGQVATLAASRLRTDPEDVRPA